VNLSVLIATYGDEDWNDLGWARAYPSAASQEPLEVLRFHDPEGTIASVRNELGAQAKGDWLCFLDADDELAPGFLEAMRRELEREGPPPCPDPLLLTPAVSYVRRGRPQPATFNQEVPLHQANWLVVGTLVERDLFQKVGGFEDYPHGFEDFSLWSKCVRVGARIVKVPGAVYIAHVNPESKHRQGWRNRPWQVATHERVVSELDDWEREHGSLLAQG
jgi:GT2 family glycosyltransferase